MTTRSAPQKFGPGQLAVLVAGLLVLVALLFAEPAVLHNNTEAPRPAEAPAAGPQQTNGTESSTELALPPLEMSEGLKSSLEGPNRQLAAAHSKADSAEAYRAKAKAYAGKSAAHAAQALDSAAKLSGKPEDFRAAADAYRDAALAASESGGQNAELFRGLNARAIACYTQYLRLKPGDEDAETELALRHVDSEAPMQGIQKLRQLAADNPGNYKANLYLGLFSMRTNQVDKAIERFRAAIQAAPQQPEPYYYLGLALAGQNKAAEARQMLEKARERAQDPALRDQIDAQLRNL